MIIFVTAKGDHTALDTLLYLSQLQVTVWYPVPYLVYTTSCKLMIVNDNCD